MTMLLLPVQMAQQPAVAHALQVREAVCTDDYAAFFRLYGAAPGMGRALLDMFVSVVRWRALNALVRVFKPSLGVDFVARLLGFAPRQGGASASDATAEPQGEAAALEVLPGCSAAVFPGKYPAAVRLLSGVTAPSHAMLC
jgi:SAC3/GANP family